MSHSPLRFLPAVIRKRPIHLTLFITRRCNARCPFCFYLKEKDLNSGQFGSKHEVTLEEIEGVSSSLGSLLWVAFSGGEIYLRSDLVEISKVLYKNNRPSIMLYPTNGLMPELIRERTVEILRNSPESAIVVKLSIDGLHERHDALRGATGGFDKVIETYRLLSPLLKEHPNFELGVNTVFTAENENDMDGIIAFVRRLEGIRTHTISLIRGDIRDSSLKAVSYEKYLNAVKKLDADVRTRTYGFKGARLKAAQDNLQRRLIYRTVRENRKCLPCHAGRLNLVLTETGDLYPCEKFRESFKLGNIRDDGYDVNKILRSERAKAVLSSIKSCFCTHECYMMTNILFNPRMYPGLAKEYLSYKEILLKDHAKANS